MNFEKAMKAIENMKPETKHAVIQAGLDQQSAWAVNWLNTTTVSEMSRVYMTILAGLKNPNEDMKIIARFALFGFASATIARDNKETEQNAEDKK